MELLDNLAAIGITTKVLQYAVLAGIVIFVVGMYWRYIVAGAAVVACAFIFLAPAESSSIASNDVVSQADVAPAEFIEDCIKYNEGASKASCQKLWKESGNGKD
jgi:hypothetical protein